MKAKQNRIKNIRTKSGKSVYLVKKLSIKAARMITGVIPNIIFNPLRAES